VSWASTKWPGTTESQLGVGRALFVANCNRCHGYPDVAAIPDDRWPAIVERMARNAKLDTDQGNSVLGFILAARHH
jgi:hypothetical protein